MRTDICFINILVLMVVKSILSFVLSFQCTRFYWFVLFILSIVALSSYYGLLNNLGARVSKCGLVNSSLIVKFVSQKHWDNRRQFTQGLYIYIYGSGQTLYVLSSENPNTASVFLSASLFYSIFVRDLSYNFIDYQTSE